MKDVIKLASLIAGNLHTITVGEDGERIVWKDEAPQDLQEWFRDISGEYTGYRFAELDECYIVLSDLCWMIADQMDENSTPEDLEEAIITHEYASVYNADRLD